MSQLQDGYAIGEYIIDMSNIPYHIEMESTLISNQLITKENMLFFNGVKFESMLNELSEFLNAIVVKQDEILSVMETQITSIIEVIKTEEDLITVFLGMAKYYTRSYNLGRKFFINESQAKRLYFGRCYALVKLQEFMNMVHGMYIEIPYWATEMATTLEHRR